MDVTFSFDPACPWTWRASRWLVRVAPARDLTIRWRPFSLLILSGGNMPDRYRAPAEASARALRLVAALADAGRDDDTGRFYTTLGGWVHDDGRPLTPELVAEAAEAVGLADAAKALDDPSLDDAVRRSHDAAFASAGPDIGSPVLAVPSAPRAVHGPILTEVPETAAAVELWDALQPMLHSGIFLEIKRGRAQP